MSLAFAWGLSDLRVGIIGLPTRQSQNINQTQGARFEMRRVSNSQCKAGDGICIDRSKECVSELAMGNCRILPSKLRGGWVPWLDQCVLFLLRHLHTDH